MNDHMEAFQNLARHAIDEAIFGPRIVVHPANHPGVSHIICDSIGIPVISTVVVSEGSLYVMSKDAYDGLVERWQQMVGGK